MKSLFMNNVKSIITLLIILSVQCYSQWQQTNFPSSAKVNTLVVFGSRIYAGTNGDGILMSTDNGDSWNKLNEGLQSEVVYAIYIDSTNLPAGQTGIFAGTATGVSISTNNGLTWETINSGLPRQPVTSIAHGSYTKIYAGAWDGIYYSTNYGKEWVKIQELSFITMPVNSLAVIDDFIYVSTYAGGLFFSPNAGIKWYDLSIWIYEYESILSTIIVSQRLVQVYALSQIGNNIIASAGYKGDVYSSPADDTTSFSQCSIPLAYKPILSFAKHDSSLYAGDFIGNIYKSNPDGSSWVQLPISLTDHSINALALNESYIFVCTGDGIWRLKYPEGITTVDDISEVPTGFVLEQNYPNPFNPSTIIEYELPSSSFVNLKVYNSLGEEVATLVNEIKSPGRYKVEFNGKDLSSGIYFYLLNTEKFSQSKKMIMIK
jgi:photosystem II stability/assembly factor-like uncharacterized protein